jgi:hypothetical protein
MPHLINGWSLTVNDATKAVAERSRVLFPAVELVFVGQAAIAKTAIERWDLTDVAYLAAGTPTPLSPRPDQLRYYTDGNADAVEEAAQAGYNAQHVDVRNLNDLKKLDGATTLIATGLIPFLPDLAARAMFANLAHMGFQTLIFNSSNPIVDAVKSEEVHGTQTIADQYAKLGLQLHFRTPDQVGELVNGCWHLKDVSPVSEFYKDHELGPAFKGRSFYTIYHATVL